MIHSLLDTWNCRLRINHLWVICSTLCITAITSEAAMAQVCGTPGKDGVAATVGGVLNTYYPGTGSATGTTVTVGTVRSGGGNAITAGDLILIMQMQDGSTTNFANSAAYGGGMNSTVGNYEYARVSAFSGSTLTLTKALINTYTQGTQKTFQVIRIPQYISATLDGSVTALPWDGSSGGVVAIDVYNNLDFNNKSINVTGQGFRGGGSRDVAYWYASPIDKTVPTVVAGTYAGTNNFYANNKLASFKGEGTAGTPRYTYNGTTLQNSGAEGYPLGDLGRGAPGNAGGGGVVAGILKTTSPKTIPGHDAGGGGGGNIGTGGLGGDTWEPATGGRWQNGGFGGSSITASTSRILLGGGGGAGITTNSTQMVDRSADDGIINGGPGGGIVMVRTGTITGTGTISAQGVMGTKGNSTDAGGGGGAGGSVVVAARSGSFAGLSVNVSGGNGSDATYREHGPGGGGGGGLVAYGGGATGMPSNTIAGGAAGFDLSVPPYNHGSMPGSLGGTVSTLVHTGCTKTKILLVKRITAINGQPITGVLRESDDDKDPNWPSATFLQGAITYGTAGLNDAGKVKPGDELEYTIYYLNTGNGSAKNVRVCDRLNKNLIFQTQFDATNAATVGKGISLNPGGTSTSQYLTNIDNDDKGFLSTSTPLPTNCNLAGNTIDSVNLSNNVVVVDLADNVTALPGIISPGNPSNSFGYIKFKVKVKP
jgi:uncharacterized repeat protein (TIGR01451 family)